MSAQEIIAFIGNAEKKTNVKVTFEGELATAVPASVTKLGNVLFGDWKDIEPLLANLTENKDYVWNKMAVTQLFHCLINVTLMHVSNQVLFPRPSNYRRQCCRYDGCRHFLCSHEILHSHKVRNYYTKNSDNCLCFCQIQCIFM